MSNELFEEVLCYPGLPTLPTVAVQLLELTGDPNVHLTDISRLVRSDQGLATKVLRTVNSSFYGLDTPCTSINRALAFLGLNAVKSLVLGFSLVDLTRSLQGDDRFDFITYWRRAIYSASGARFIAQTTGACDPDEAFTCGMFQDMGMLATVLVLKERYLAVLDEAGDHHEQLPAHEQDRFGFTHGDIGAALAEKWKMPGIVAECVRHHHAAGTAPEDFRTVVRVVALGRLATDVLNDPHSDERMTELLRHAVEWFGLETEGLESLLGAIAESADDLARVLDQDVGVLPDVQETIARAGELMTTFQLETQRQVVELQRQQEDLTVKVETDALTGVANRAKFNSLIAELVEQAGSQSRPVGLLFIDADRFKSVNDTHGHQAGDAVLVELASRIGAEVGALGHVCRYGGEEFAILLPGTDAHRSADVAERIRRRVAQRPFDLRSSSAGDLEVTISIGVAAIDPGHPEGPSDAKSLTLAADMAVYRAKEEGRNRVCLPPEAFSIPPVPAETAAPPAPAPAPPSQMPSPTIVPLPGISSSHVLLIDSDALASTLLIGAFKRQPDVKVTWIRTGDQAVHWLRQRVERREDLPGLIICEHDLAGQSGVEVAERLLAITAALAPRLVMLTRSDREADRQHCLAAGAAQAWSKSDVVRSLADWTRRMLDEISTRRRAA